jgi:hypothetical protein
VQDFQTKVRNWANERGLIQGSSPALQMVKLREEVKELEQAIEACDEAEMRDAIGDIQVVLAVICAQKGWTVEMCRGMAFDAIKSRAGKLVDGVFVKSV